MELQRLYYARLYSQTAAEVSEFFSKPWPADGKVNDLFDNLIIGMSLTYTFPFAIRVALALLCCVCVVSPALLDKYVLSTFGIRLNNGRQLLKDVYEKFVCLFGALKYIFYIASHV